MVAKDTDGDGVLDWEEPLYGLDPTKKETTPGIPDITILNKLRINQESNTATEAAQNVENLSETEKFSRELFSTVASLNQNGVLDQAMAEKISSSLSEQIKNSVPRKVFLLSDIKIINNSTQAFTDYLNALNTIYKKYPLKYTALDVLQKFLIDENNVDTSVLVELDPIIEQENKIISAMVKMNVPQSVAPMHLDFINALQRLVENVSDIRLYEDDPIVALGGISQYEKNSTLLDSAKQNLINTFYQKLSN